MNLKNCQGMTLIEVMIAIFLFVFILGIISGTSLSISNTAEGTNNSAKSSRFAGIVIMHMQKHICKAASSFDIVDSVDWDGDGNNDTSLEYKIYGASNVYNPPPITSRYEFLTGSQDILYYENSALVSPVILTDNIVNCTFSIVPTDGVVLHVEIEAVDNNGENPCALDTWIEATETASPSVY